MGYSASNILNWNLIYLDYLESELIWTWKYA